MKRVIISFVLLISIVILSILESTYVKDFCKDKCIKIEECERLFREDKDACLKKVEDVNKEWENDHLFLMVFINHSIIDDITMETVRMPSYVKCEDDGEFYAACALIKRSLDQMKSDQRMTIDTFY